MKNIKTLNKITDDDGNAWELQCDSDNYIVGKISTSTNSKTGEVTELMQSPHYFGRLPRAILALAEAVARQDATDLRDMLERYERVSHGVIDATKGL